MENIKGKSEIGGKAHIGDMNNASANRLPVHIQTLQSCRIVENYRIQKS